MNTDNFDEFKDKAKELFETNINILPYHMLDLSFKTMMSEVIYNMFVIKSAVGNLLLSVLNNIDYINILLKEGFVNYTLNKGIFKITDFKNSYGIEDETNDIMDIITSMEFEILDNNNISIINGSITCIYDRDEKCGELLISIDESISDKFMVDVDLSETYFKSDNIIEKYNIIDRVLLINKNSTELIRAINEVIGDIYDYQDTNKRSVFIIDNKE